MMILPRDDLQKQKVLQEVMEEFSDEYTYTEEEVNRILKDLDVDDYVLFRRGLVNFGYLGRDPYKGTYWVIRFRLSHEELLRIARLKRKIDDS